MVFLVSNFFEKDNFSIFAASYGFILGWLVFEV